MTTSIVDIYPLSPLQHGLLFHSLSEPDAGLYIEQLSWTFHGQLDMGASTRAWRAVIARHAIFRTAFEWEGVEQPLQVVLSHAELPMEELDWRGLAAEVQERRLQLLLKDERGRAFDLTGPPLMRFQVIHLSEGLHEFIWTHHHLLLDGWSVPLVLNEVFDLYSGYLMGRDPALPPVAPFRDYISWLSAQDIEAARRYWRTMLEGAELPTPVPWRRQSADSRQFQTAEFQLSAAATEALSTLARHQRVTMNTIVQSVWALLLMRYSGRDDVVFGTVVSGRPPSVPGVESMVGLLINALPVRVKRPEARSMVSWWQQLQAQQAELRQYEYCVLVDIRNWAGLPADCPLFHTLIGYENYPLTRSPRAPHDSGAEDGLRISHVRSHSRTNYALTAIVLPGPPLRMRMLYDAGRVDAGTVGRMLEHLARLLELCAERPGDSPLSIASALPEEERRTIFCWSTAVADYPRDAAVGELLARVAERQPHRIAVEFGSERLSYEELDRRANRTAHYLRRLGVTRGTRVAVCLPRSAELVVSLLAVLKAGGAYVPIDPEYPAARKRLMVEDSAARVMLTTASLQDEMAGLCDIITAESIEFWDGRLESVVGGGDAAYIMYTSGSTGRPKGAVIPHRAITRLSLSTNYIQLTPADRVAQASNASFDAATFEIWATLLAGATIVGIGREEVLSPDKLAQLLHTRGVTVMFLTTALFNQVARIRPDAFASLECLLTGGERGDSAAMNEVLTCGRPRRLLHVYGPTECTTFATWYEVTEPPAGDSVPIGRPLANTEVWLLDRHMNPAPIGAPGEIFLGGDGLALGYVNDDQLTAKCFVPHPFREGARLYRTGDLGRYRDDGNLEFLGRMDDQVKLRGFRVEPSEIKAALLQHPAVEDGVVIAREDDGRGCRLIAYVVASHFDEQDLRRHLARLLPHFMMPSGLVRVERLPLNANGKVDRGALPPEDDIDGDAHSAPRTAVEERLVSIWIQVLGREAPGVDQSFFELGGHSLNAIQLVSRIRDVFKVELTLKALFQSPSIMQLAAEIEELLVAKLESISEDEAQRLAGRAGE